MEAEVRAVRALAAAVRLGLVHLQWPHQQARDQIEERVKAQWLVLVCAWLLRAVGCCRREYRHRGWAVLAVKVGQAVQSKVQESPWELLERLAQVPQESSARALSQPAQQLREQQPHQPPQIQEQPAQQLR